jgi:ABC-type cobalt transport system substrate-binding protein
MKNKIFALMIVAILLISSISTAFAGGGQVRGEEGQGSTNQVQVQYPPPFQP